MNNLQFHGGEEFRDNSLLNSSSTDSSNKSKHNVNEELNILDKLITKDAIASPKLLNDIHDYEENYKNKLKNDLIKNKIKLIRNQRQ